MHFPRAAASGGEISQRCMGNPTAESRAKAPRQQCTIAAGIGREPFEQRRKFGGGEFLTELNTTAGRNHYNATYSTVHACRHPSGPHAEVNFKRCRSILHSCSVLEFSRTGSKPCTQSLGRCTDKKTDVRAGSGLQLLSGPESITETGATHE